MSFTAYQHNAVIRAMAEGAGMLKAFGQSELFKDDPIGEDARRTAEDLHTGGKLVIDWLVYMPSLVTAARAALEALDDPRMSTAQFDDGEMIDKRLEAVKKLRAAITAVTI